MPGRPRDRYAAAAAYLLAPSGGRLDHGAGATAGLGGGNGIYSLLVESRPRRLAAAGAPGGRWRAEVAPGSAGRNPTPASCQPAVATLLAPISFGGIADALSTQILMDLRMKTPILACWMRQ